MWTGKDDENKKLICFPRVLAESIISGVHSKGAYNLRTFSISKNECPSTDIDDPT